MNIVRKDIVVGIVILKDTVKTNHETVVVIEVEKTQQIVVALKIMNLFVLMFMVNHQAQKIVVSIETTVKTAGIGNIDVWWGQTVL
jgi:hypothetical protein